MAQPEYPKAVENLEAGPSEHREETITRLEPAQREERGRGRFVVATLVFLTLLLAALLIRANSQIGSLEGALADLQGQLERSRATVAAHQAHLGEIRGEVDTLMGQLGALDRLVDHDPATRPSAPAGESAAGPGSEAPQ